MYRNTLTTITAIFSLTINLVFTQVVINEIHYNPGSAQGSDADFEFLELYNPGTTDIDMSGYSFSQGVTHVFADGTTLAAGAYMIVSIYSYQASGNVNGNITENVYDPDGDGLHENGAVVVEWTSGGISNGGEDVTIIDAAGAVVDSVDYEDGTNAFGDWGTSHDGGGGSLELIDATSDNSLAASWQTSWVIGGTPGAASSTEPDAIVMTIYNIQYTTDPNGASTVTDQYIQTSGVITGVDRLGFNSAFTIQDGTGGWNGIYCWWAAPDTLGLGDAVTIRGYVVEYNGYGALGDTTAGMTQFTAGRVISHDSEGNALPAPVVLDLEEVADEQYEGVRITTSSKVVEAANDDNNGEWRISNNLDASDTDADTINVNDRFAVTDPAYGTIATVTGPLNQWGGSDNSGPSWRIEPATGADVVVACENSNLTISVEMIDSYGDGWNGAMYTILSYQGQVVGSGGLDGGSFGVDSYCLFEGDFSIVIGGGSYDSEISFNIVDAFGNDLIAGGVANLNPNPPFIPDPYYAFTVTGINTTSGCTDPDAVNYDLAANAELDDGSCYYLGEVCESPIAVGGSGVAASDIDQFFAYTAAATGNMTVSSVGQTQEDTYLVILSSCDIGYEYEIDPGTGDTLYVTSYYEDVLATNDDADYGTGVYQSEATICVVGGETYLIAWISMYYPYDESFAFSVEETPDIITPDNVSAYGYEDGIEVSWAPIPTGCAGDDDTRSTTSASSYGPLKFKPGAREHIVGKVRQRQSSERTEVRVPTLTRDCPAGESEIVFYMAGSSWASECGYTVYDSEDNIIATATGYATEVAIAACLADGDYTVVGTDSYGDGWNGGVFYATLDGSTIFSMGMTSGELVEGSFNLNASAVYGCTDPTAANYDPTATDDDGSCLYPGAACSAPVVISDPAVGDTDSEKGWFQITIPTGVEGKLIFGSSSSDYYYIYSGCEYGLGVYPDYDYTNWVYYTGYIYQSTEIDFSSATLDYNGTATMDTYAGTTLWIKSRYVVDYGYSRTTSIRFEETIYGCTDPNASNYDPTAPVDDGG